MATIPMQPGMTFDGHNDDQSPLNPNIAGGGVQPRRVNDPRGGAMDLIKRALEGYNIQDYGYSGQGNAQNAMVQNQAAANMSAQPGMDNRINVYDIMNLINPQAQGAGLQDAGRGFDALLAQLGQAGGVGVRDFTDPNSTGVFQNNGATYDVRRALRPGSDQMIDVPLEQQLRVHAKNQERAAANPEAYATPAPARAKFVSPAMMREAGVNNADEYRQKFGG